MKMTLIALALTAIFSFGIQAHEGHSHGQGKVQPTKGGVKMKGEKFFLEVVGTKKEIKIYPLKQADAKSQTLSGIPLNQVKVSATYSLPRSKSNQTITLKAEGDHFTGAVETKSSHRYQVDVSIETLGEEEKLTYQIEPQE